MKFVVAVGSGHEASLLCNLLNKDGSELRCRSFSDSTIGILRALVGLRRAQTLLTLHSPIPHPFLEKAAHSRQIPVVVVWTERAITRVLEKPHMITHIVRARLNHISTSALVDEELKKIGINATLLELFGKQASPTMLETYLSSLGRPVKDRRPTQHTLAISGLDLFAIDVANWNDRLNTVWNAQVLKFGSKLEILQSLYVLARSDLWYTIGSVRVSGWLTLTARLLRKRRLMHWVGTDIEIIRREPAFVATLNGPRIRHLAEVSWQVDDLRSLGIVASIAPLPPRISQASATDLPEILTILLYLPKLRPELYGRIEYERLVREFKDAPVRFLLVGGGSMDAPEDGHFRDLGWRASLEEVYDQSSALVRFTKHDGLSLMVLEALAHGRHVLWTKELPFVTTVRDYQDLTNGLTKLLERHIQRDLRPQLEAAQFVASEYEPERCMAKIVSAWDALVGLSVRR